MKSVISKYFDMQTLIVILKSKTNYISSINETLFVSKSNLKQEI